MKSYVIDSLEQINTYIDRINIESAKENDLELAQTIRMGFIHCLGEIAYAIDKINENKSIGSDEKKVLFTEVSNTTRRISKCLSELAYIRTVTEIEKEVYIEKPTFYRKLISYLKND
ncbi:hypothetical protein ACOJIU_18760 (plasmid) [Carnobacterium maltaromaticum]|uniref:hypothetical protein n=1 Tax=Carnobacterium maltaromaticum TaxID=2751 RepID=UPI00345072F3